MQLVDLSDLSIWNQKFLPIVEDPKPYNILYGGSGSGKSQTMIQLFLMESIDPQNQNQTFFVIRKVASTLRNSVFADFKNKINDWNIGGFVRAMESHLEIRGVNGNKIVFLGCDDSEKLKSLSQAKAIWIEEATELSIEDFTQVTLRLRGLSKHKKCIYITFNPVSDSHWIKKRFFDEVPEFEKDKIQIIHSTYRDALEFLDDEYPIRMQSLFEIDPVYAQIYADGEWGVLDRELLFAWAFNEKIHVQNRVIPIHKGIDIGVSFDFNVPNTATVFQYLKNGPGALFYATINFVETIRIGDINKLCEYILEAYPLSPGQEYYINGDATGGARAELSTDNKSAYHFIRTKMLLMQEQIKVKKINPSHRASRLHTNLVFKKCNVQISGINCKELIIDLKEAKIDIHGDLDPWKKKNPKRSHALDTARYAISSNFSEMPREFNIGKYESMFESGN